MTVRSSPFTMAMVDSRGLLVVAALLHYVASSVSAVQVAESEASLAYSRATAGVHRVDASLHTRAEDQVASLRGLRSLSHRSLSQSAAAANVFRSAAASHARGGMKLHRQVPGAVPLYTPKMGLANVTAPTAFPPPPPVLHPWKDMQPLDTAVGNYIISGFIAQPTVTPVPSQSSLDLAFACPALLTWPQQVSVSAPDPCGSMDTGNWTVTGGALMINWMTSCVDTTSPGITAPSVSSVTTYTVANGDLFGTSQERPTLTGGVIDLRDCGGATVFTVEEKVYKQGGKPDPDACDLYHSCDGVVYFQYFIKDRQGKVIALTPYTTIFQESFEVQDPAGVMIASVSRNGWAPPEQASAEYCRDNKPRMWNLKYAETPPGTWQEVTAQWPIAAMMTMLAQRDQKRAPNGQVLWSNCEAMKSGGYVLLGAFGFCCCVCIPMAIFLVCSAPLLRALGEAESRFLPKRMGKPAYYN